VTTGFSSIFSVVAGSGDRRYLLVGEEGPRLDEVRLAVSGLGGVELPKLCKELSDLLLCSEGVEDLLSSPLRELVLGVRLTGD